MPNFQPDQATFGDPVGYGNWDDGHAREHLQFAQMFALQSPTVFIDGADLLSFLATTGSTRQSQLQAHQKVHGLLRQPSGITGIDLAAVNLDDEAGFYQWLTLHATEHAQIRQFLGIT